VTAPRVLGLVLLGVLGFLVAVAGSLMQAGWFPLGLLLSLGGAVALFWGGALAVRGKLGAVVPAVVWAVTVLVLTTARPAGDFLFAAGAGSYLYLLGGMLAAGLCAALAPTPHRLFEVRATGGPRPPTGPRTAGR
jgi:hypothetical protein